jgi:hypothetical protein
MCRIFTFLFWGVVGVVGVPVVGIVFYLALSSFTGLKGPPTASNRAPPAVGPKTERVVMTQTHWTRGGFDTIMMLDFAVRNDNDYAVKDLTIKCQHFGPSGTRIDQNSRTVYERIPAHSSFSRQQFNMGFFHSQVAKSSCQVVDYVAAS